VSEVVLQWEYLGQKRVLQGKKIAAQKIAGKYLAFQGGDLLPLLL
jgi:hypothetical protein